MTQVFFTSDPHFGHENILQFEPARQKLGATIEDHDVELIARINQRVQPDDILYILGDFCLGSPGYAKKCLQAINGTKILVRGNHDRNTYKQMLSWGFASVCESVELKICKQKVLLHHYPYRWSWWKQLWCKMHRGMKNDFHKRPIDRGQWLLHGHSHSVPHRPGDDAPHIHGRQVNIGVDCWDFRPVSLQQIEAIIQTYENKAAKLSTWQKMKNKLKFF